MLEKNEVAQSIRNALSWEVPRGHRRLRTIAVAGVLGLLSLLMLLTANSDYSPVLQLRGDDKLLDTVLNETLGFHKIFVINMKKASYRRDRITLAAALTGLQVEIIEAATTSDIDWANIPTKGKGYNESEPTSKNMASWRSHVNAVKAIVDQNLGSALILEDDADWDVRIKDQLRDYAITTRQLVQPLKSNPEEFLDPTYYRNNYTKYNEPIAPGLVPAQWNWTEPSAATLKPKESAYGDLSRWDILWLGHCGQRMARPGAECKRTPLARVLHENDESVAEHQHFANYWSGNEYKDQHNNHTRVTHWSCAQVCNTAYAVSREGAKKLLYDYGVRYYGGMSDAMLRHICDGDTPWEMRACLTVSPPLFNQYGLKRDKTFDKTLNIRFSAQGNLDRLANGQRPFRDSWPDAPDVHLDSANAEETAPTKQTS